MRTVIRFVKGDITQQDVDAIVNAANSVLLGGGGVDGAIHRAAGPELLQECRHMKETELASTGGLLPTGQAVITKGYRLLARFVIHTVGPIYQSDAHPQESLYNAYSNSLALAEKHGLQTIAFPSISTGVYGYPVAEAAEMALRAARDFSERKDTALREIRFVLFSDHDYGVFRETAEKMGLEE